ncbi:hypothetical protein OIU85_025693 [Salix viminalis]|uniref:U-box domain-containing protein n=1 Tax=Salix viminalis TaxID=40686 RepID=A0A9Q0TM21_SALVM|nr:hypothetical protein OIU85_025693 [Salix viminalis]
MLYSGSQARLRGLSFLTEFTTKLWIPVLVNLQFTTRIGSQRELIKLLPFLLSTSLSRHSRVVHKIILQDQLVPSAPFSPQPTVSKKLYDAVFGRSSKPRVHEAEGNGKAEKLNNGAHSSGSSPIEIKHTVTISFNMATFPGQDIENHSLENVPDNTSIPDKGLLTASNTDLNDDICNSSARQESEGDNAHMLNSSSHTKANELALKTLAKSVFELQRTEDSGDATVSELSNSKKAINADASTEGPNGSRENFDEGSVFDSNPHDFICPLTGELFEDPVTLETGRTFEREAIREWFDLGNRTCPVTGKTLACSAVPLTNSILKLVIDGWKMVKE